MASGGQTCFFFTTLTCRQSPYLHDLGPDPTLQDASADAYRASFTTGYLYVAAERMDPRTGALRRVNVCFVFFCCRWECPGHKDTRRWSRATVHTWTRSGRRMGQTNAEQMWVADMLLLLLLLHLLLLRFLLHSRLNHPTTLFQRNYFLIVSQRWFIIPHSLSILIHFLFSRPSFISSVYFLYILSFLFYFIFFALYLSAPGWVTTSRGSDCSLWLMQTFKEFPFSWWDCSIRYCCALRLFVFFMLNVNVYSDTEVWRNTSVGLFLANW